jgi:hypothetical protein
MSNVDVVRAMYDESVFFAYEYRLATGDAYRNVELITVRGERIEEIQVFFGGRTD